MSAFFIAYFPVVILASDMVLEAVKLPLQSIFMVKWYKIP